jgi:hypothetical protein
VGGRGVGEREKVEMLDRAEGGGGKGAPGWHEVDKVLPARSIENRRREPQLAENLAERSVERSGDAAKRGKDQWDADRISTGFVFLTEDEVAKKGKW